MVNGPSVFLIFEDAMKSREEQKKMHKTTAEAIEESRKKKMSTTHNKTHIKLDILKRFFREMYRKPLQNA